MKPDLVKNMFRRVACDLAAVSWRLNRCDYAPVCKLYNPENVGCHISQEISRCGKHRELTKRRMPIHA